MVDRQKMYDFLMSVKVKKGPLRGGFQVTEGGEVDTRGTYTSMAVASLLNIITPELADVCTASAYKDSNYSNDITMRKYA
eukprot:jgi/Bigna1/135876/aug1.31_g10584